MSGKFLNKLNYFFSEDNSFDFNCKLCSVEATVAVEEVAYGVKDISLASNLLPYNENLAYLNITTLEGEIMCVEISANGFCPVSAKLVYFIIFSNLFNINIVHNK